jgi:dTDP-4-amino-4,6-dideoxygalactose transaminase
VVVPAYTCPLVPLAIAHCGLTPVACDLARSHFDLCPEALERACNEDTLAVIPTHLGGRVARLDHVMRVARRAGASVIEDAAQAMGATTHGRPAGTVGDIGFYSMAVGKGLTIYEGGALVAGDEALRGALRETSGNMVPLRPDWELLRSLQLAGYLLLYAPRPLVLAYGLPLRVALMKGDLMKAAGDTLPARIPLHRVGRWRKAVGASAARRLPGLIDALATQAARRMDMLADVPGVLVQRDAAGGRGTWPCFMVLMPTQAARDAALARLWRSGLGVGRMFLHALSDYPALAPMMRGASTPNARDFAQRMLVVSNSTWLGDAAFAGICRELRTAAEKNS